MRKMLFGVVCGLILFAGGAYAWQGPQDNWYEIDAWHGWEDGGQTNYFSTWISGIVVGPDDNLYVIDGGSNRIVVLDQDGAFVREWGGSGQGEGKFYFSSHGDVAFDSTGRVYVADTYNARVQVFDPDGTFVTMWGATNAWGQPATGTGDGEFNTPLGLTVGPNDLVYVADHNNHRIQVFEPDGTFVRKWGSQGTLEGQFVTGPQDVAFVGDNTLYVSTPYSWPASRFEVFDADGNFVRRVLASDAYVEPTLSFFDGLLFCWSGAFMLDGPRVVYRNTHGTNLVPVAKGLDETYFDHRQRYYYRDGANREHRTVVKCKRRYTAWPIEEWKAGILPVPNPVLLKFEQRPGSYVMDIEYLIQDADSGTGKVALAAFEGGTNNFSHFISVQTFMEGTGGNVGDGVTFNTTNRVVWDITADVDTEYFNVRMAVMAHDNDRGLWDVEFITLPAEGEDPELTISRSWLNPNALIPVWYWLLGNAAEEGVELRHDSGLGKKAIFAVGGAHDGEVLAYDYYTYQANNIWMTTAGWDFLAARLGYRMATADEKNRAYAGRDWNNFLGQPGYNHFVKE